MGLVEAEAEGGGTKADVVRPSGSPPISDATGPTGLKGCLWCLCFRLKDEDAS